MKNIVPAFTETHATFLRDFLTSPQRAKGTMTYPQLAGFLFSMANGPELIPPSEWMPIIFSDQDAGYETRDEAERVLQAMMSLYNDCGRAVSGAPCFEAVRTRRRAQHYTLLLRVINNSSRFRHQRFEGEANNKK